MRHQRRHMPIAAILALALTPFLGACSPSEPTRARRVDPVIVRDVPNVLRGTIGAEATIRGVDPVLVSGYGLVVGLDGTGGGELPDNIAAHMERELGLRGIGSASDATAPGLVDPITGTPLSPRQLLRDSDTAVVVVYAAVPPGSPAGAKFDVFVRALNASSTTSLEGGLLWSTDLQIGSPSIVGGRQTRSIAEAYGPIFINPFAEPGAEGQDTLNRREGRILGGGQVTAPLELEIVLDNPSHNKARAIISAINSRFPEGPGDDGPTARGRRGENSFSIALRIPQAWRDRPQEFLAVLTHLQVNHQAAPQVYAERYVRALKAEPGVATDVSLSLEALGKPVLPLIRDMYDYPEQDPRLAALRAGAALHDPRAAERLKIMVETEPDDQLRAQAMTLLGQIEAGPTVDIALRERVVEETKLLTRIAAYEALAERAIRRQMTNLIERERSRTLADGPPLSYGQVEHLAKVYLPSGTIQGVAREPVSNTFTLDRVPLGDGLIYATVQDEPRIALLGETPRLKRPLFVSIWSDRLMLLAESETSKIRVRYQDHRTETSATFEMDGDDIAELIRYMAHTSTPESPGPGLGLTYSEVVGALYEIHTADGMQNVAFATEADRLMASLLQAAQAGIAEDRPETSEGEVDIESLQDLLNRDGIDGPDPTPADEDRPSMVVPLNPQPADDKKK